MLDISNIHGRGWRLSERSDGFYAIEKEDESNVFDSDIAAYAYVKAKAATGHPAALVALEMHGNRWGKSDAT